ncbi:hypothetical protein [Mesorhizobium shangrilense]|uniref:Uncharacterized protein n=1 Tax=Mesorhizobium shangrilense TaxID=460060 RepID=A0ABV2D6A8_9HYPH
MDSHNEMPKLIPGRPEGSGPPEPRPLDAATMRAISPLPPPEEVFIDWLMSVPHGADLEVAARRKIALIDRRGSLHPDVFRLRTLLAVIAGTGVWPKHIRNV